MYIHWKPSLELGNDLIDTQHRMEVLLCRKLDIAIKSKLSDQAIRWVMTELRKFTEFHFVSEENLMHEIGYPDVHEHSMIHADLLMQLDMTLAKIRHHKEFPEDLLYFLNSWLGQHIVKEDLKLVAFLKTSTQRPIGEDLYAEYLLNEDGE
jgi:hemerythrin-like metal-binding protein